MLRSPQRTPSQNVAFSYSASSIFSKSGRFIQGNEGYQNDLFVVGPPFRPACRRELPPGRGAQISQNLFKKSLFELLARNAGPDFWSNLIQIEASSPLGPPLRPATRRDSLPGRGAQLSQNLFKKTFGTTLGVLLAQDFGEICSKSKLLQFWAPPFRPPIRRDSPPGKGGANVSKFVQKFAF